MLSCFLKLIHWLSIPIVVICLAMAVRTAFIWNNYDIFYFGRYPQWFSLIYIGLFGTSADWHTFEPGHTTTFGSGIGPFYHHLVARGGTFSLTGGSLPYTIVTHDGYIFGWRTYSLGGPTLRTDYWIHLPYAPFIALLVSSAILVHWRLQALKLRRQNREGLCPNCEYDLRAHRPGQRCPECGTFIPARDSAIIPTDKRSGT